jgi:tRNA-dihydrouridine synthase B
MLAPMQGVTNSALRSLFIDWVRPDVVFTEFMRVNPAAAQRRLSAADLAEAGSSGDDVPLVVQLIGHGREALVSGSQAAQDAGAAHINLNMGCPFGRMTSGQTGGGMLRSPQELSSIIPALRKAIRGTFSIKLRSGYDNPRQIFDLLPLFEASGVDFLVLHPRTVLQKYAGFADHGITAEAVQRSTLPIIANGDIRSVTMGRHVLRETGAAGLMLGRGAISDPLLFQRLRNGAPPDPQPQERAATISRYLNELLTRYQTLFCGEAQILGKIKEIVSTIHEPAFEKEFHRLKKARGIEAFRELLAELA